MTKKLIIHNEQGLPDATVLKVVESIIRKGKISTTSKGKQYCFHTVASETQVTEDWVIKIDTHVTVVKQPSGTETFYVWQKDTATPILEIGGELEHERI